MSRLEQDNTSADIHQTTAARIPTEYGDFRLHHYASDCDAKEHLALVMGDVTNKEGVLVRVHSECFTGDVLGSLRCDCGPQLRAAMRLIAEAGSGVIVYLRQEGRGIGLAQKLAAYSLQDQGYDTVDADLLLGHGADEREYSAAAAILKDLCVESVCLLTNNPSKIEQLSELGVRVQRRLPLETPVTAENAGYLATKVQRMRHLLNLSEGADRRHSTLAVLPSDVECRIVQLRADARAFYLQEGRPFVTLSYAQSLDGSIALPSGGPLRLSSDQSMTMTHALRAVHDAILVGIGTVLADDPRLTVRLVAGDNPQPVVLDTHLRLPVDSRLLSHPKGVWLATTDAGFPRHDVLGNTGARIIHVPATDRERIDLNALLCRLGERGIGSVMVEGGAQVLSSFLCGGLANAAVITVAPFYVGGASPLAQADGAGSKVQNFPRLELSATMQVGPDLVLWGRPVAHEAELDKDSYAPS